MVKSGKGPLYAKFTSLAERMSGRKSAAAVARKMVIPARVLRRPLVLPELPDTV
jgi:hypothetical protein